MANLGDLATAALVAAGVKRAYIVPGASLWLPDAIHRHPELQLYCVRHESSAAFMAEADGRLTGTPAVVIASRAPGATNATNGVEAARDSSTPMLILLDDTETHLVGRDAFQKLDLQAFYRPITKAQFAVRPEDSLPDVLSHALRVATGGRPGPVVVTIPVDLGGAVSDWSPRAAGGLWPRPKPSSEQIAKIGERLAQARAPVIIAGGGALHCREQLVAVAEKFSTGVYSGFRRQDAFPNDHQLYLGHLGMLPPPVITEALRDADLVLALGTRLAEWTSQRFSLPLPGTELIQVDVDPARIGLLPPSALGVVSDVRSVLRGLVELPTNVAERDWRTSNAVYQAYAAIPEDRGSAGVDPAQVIQAMAEELPADTIMANCAGGYAAFVNRHWKYTAPHSQVASTTGTMGYSIPAAIAAKLAMPHRCVVANSGDGGFLMNGHELEVAVRYGVNIIIVVYNNRLLSGGGYLEPWDFSEIVDVDFAAYARAFGAYGVTVRDASELSFALRAARQADRVTVIDVKTDRSVTPGWVPQ